MRVGTVPGTQQVLATHCSTDGSQEGRGPGPSTVSSFQSQGQYTPLRLPLSPLTGPAPPKACTHPRLLPAPQPRFLSHCQSTMAVIINGLSQCDSCGPLKIGLNNKILAYGNFFSSPAPPFSLPHFSLVMHANALPFSPSQHLPPRDGMARGQTRFCSWGTDPPGPLPWAWHWAKRLTPVTSARPPPPRPGQDSPKSLHLTSPPTSPELPLGLLCRASPEVQVLASANPPPPPRQACSPPPPSISAPPKASVIP